MSQNPLPALLLADQLVFQQRRSFMANDFDIMDGQGQVLARLITQGDALSRMALGSRSFTLVDPAGNPLMLLEDQVNFMGDTFQLLYPDGSHLATIRKRFTFFSQQMQIELPDLTLDLRGSLMDYDFKIYAGQQTAATITRQWSGLGNALMGKSTYSVGFDPAAPPLVRIAMVGGLIALDLSREKDN